VIASRNFHSTKVAQTAAVNVNRKCINCNGSSCLQTCFSWLFSVTFMHSLAICHVVKASQRTLKYEKKSQSHWIILQLLFLWITSYALRLLGSKITRLDLEILLMPNWICMWLKQVICRQLPALGTYVLFHSHSTVNSTTRVQSTIAAHRLVIHSVWMQPRH
jgi:hypothetical protein